MFTQTYKFDQLNYGLYGNFGLPRYYINYLYNRWAPWSKIRSILRRNTVMLTIEFHCHTIASKDSLTQPQALLAACRRKAIDRLVITDHNTIAEAQRAKTLDPQRVIVGEEIMTSEGELLAAFVSEEIPPGLDPLTAIERLRQQGAFISVSHPFDAWRAGSWKLEDLLKIAPLVDAIEVFNARCLSALANQEAQSFAAQHHLLGTVGSDAHAIFELGRATLSLSDFYDAITLRNALATPVMNTRLSPGWVHLTSRYAVWRKKLSHKTN